MRLTMSLSFRVGVVALFWWLCLCLLGFVSDVWVVCYRFDVSGAFFVLLLGLGVGDWIVGGFGCECGCGLGWF